jgi:hypothetical protein
VSHRWCYNARRPWKNLQIRIINTLSVWKFRQEGWIIVLCEDNCGCFRGVCWYKGWKYFHNIFYSLVNEHSLDFIIIYSHILNKKVKLSPYFNWAPCDEIVLGSEGVAPYNLDLITRWMWVVSFMPWPLYPRERALGTEWIAVFIGILLCDFQTVRCILSMGHRGFRWAHGPDT